MRFLLRIVFTAVALWVATLIVDGVDVTAESTTTRVLTLLGVAAIFGLVNALIKPVVKTIGCVFYVLTLGLIAFVVNGLLLWFTSWLAGELDLPFHVSGFWPAFWGAIVVGLVSWALNLLAGDRD